MEIPYQGQYEKKQYLKGVYRALRPKTWVSILRFGLFLVFFVLLLGVMIAEFNGDGLQINEVARLVRHTLTLIILAYVSFYNSIRIYQKANKLWKDPITPAIRSGVVSNQGISFRSNTQQWNQFIKKDVQDDMVVLLTINHQFAIFPRSFFSSDSDWNRFVQLVEAKVIEPK
ncbi:MAG TPA: hypothetical protein VJ965_08910 [Anaerolineales bacterium]|nr:hypothetical protein [Anaerolineales bacterium]